MAAIHVTKDNFQAAILEAEKPVLLKFWAPWCTYCRRIDPAFAKVGEQYADSLLTGDINIDEEPELARQERIEVIPTLVVYKEGFDLGSIVAPESKARIEEFLAEVL